MRATIPIALSLATVVFFTRWEGVESILGPHGSYFRDLRLSTSYAVSFFGSLLVAALMLFIALSVALRRFRVSEEKLHRIAGVLLGTGLLALLPMFSHSRVRLLFGALVLSACALAWRPFSGAGRLLATLVAALFFIKTASFVWLYAQPVPAEAAFRTEASAARLQAGTAKRIVWLLFDEFDYELATSLRPSSVEMPEFDRLLKETLVATHAHSPAENTVRSVPAMFIGKRVTDAFPRGPRTLGLRIAGYNQEVAWDEQDHLFARAQRLGLRSSVVGWHHPYCRIFGSALASCSWTANICASDSLRTNAVLRRTGPTLIFPGWPVMPYRFDYLRIKAEYRVAAAEQIDQHRNQLERALDEIRRTDVDFFFMHWLVPHPPGMYDRRLNRFSAGPDVNSLDNLEVVDATIGDVRRTLEQAGLWESTALIVTGDHPMRASMWTGSPAGNREEAELCAARKDPRVPLLIKVPGQQTGAVYPAAMDSVMVYDLISAWMEGRAGTIEEIRALFADRGLQFPVHP